MKRILKLILLLMAVVIAFVSVYAIFDVSKQSPVFRRLVNVIPWAGNLHVFAGSIALVLGGLQLSSGIRKRKIAIHKVIGKIYVVSVLLGTVGAVVSLISTESGWAAKSGFWVLAILWPTVTLMGYPWRGGFDVRWHGRLMIYSYAMTCAAITLRIYLGLLLATGYSFAFAYPLSAWGGFLGNLLIAAWVLKRLPPKTVARSMVLDAADS